MLILLSIKKINLEELECGHLALDIMYGDLLQMPPYVGSLVDLLSRWNWISVD